MPLASHDGSAGTAEDARFAAFMTAFDAVKKSNGKTSSKYLKWLQPGSPWGPYLDRPFTDGLSTSEKKAHRQAQDIADCKAVAELDKRGFLRLYAHLEPAFQRDEVETVFKKAIQPLRSLGAERCRHLWSLRHALEKLAAAKTNNEPLDVRLLGEYDTYWSLRHPRGTVDPLQARDRSLSGLAGLAFCKDFAPAIEDVLEFITPPRLLILTPEEEYYIHRRTASLGLGPPDPHPVLGDLVPLIDARTLQIVMRIADGGSWKKRVLPRWRCLKRERRPGGGHRTSSTQ